MLNVLVLLGRVSKNPVLNTAGEKSIANFDIAFDSLKKDEDGNRMSCFISVVCFNAVAENCAKALHRGSKVAISGSLQQRSFLRKDGSKGTTYELIADSVEFLDPKPSEPAEVVINDPENIDVKDSPEVTPEAKFDPYTGKPLNETKKK